ncbi:MAG TPA: GNAT family N-acetyltransferase [Gemmatimonadaceae bacterium]|nr:GNAT family N-acetyltransferase [Gemmatimonadaceae bacterium]
MTGASRGPSLRGRPADDADDITVRRATASDLDVVVSLRIALLREYREHPIYGRLRPDAESRARPIFASQLDSDREAIFMAEDARHDVVGMLRCVESVSSPLLVPDRYCYLSSVYVRPDFRRRGVLRLLFERAQHWCREHGLAEIRLHNVGTRSTSAAVWDAFGFEVVEQVRLLRLDVATEHSRVAASAASAASAAAQTPASPTAPP